MKIENDDSAPVEDDFAVQVRINDPSIFAYAPRKIAHSERLEIRNIIDNLLKRGIIQPSRSPYCSRVPCPFKTRTDNLDCVSICDP